MTGKTELVTRLRGAAAENERLRQALARLCVLNQRIGEDADDETLGEIAAAIYMASLRGRSLLDEIGFHYCRGCGCSDNDACNASDAWAEPDLCSACAR